MINILLIEDEYLFKKAFLKIFQDKENCHIVGIVETLDDAITILKTHDINIVFSEAKIGFENSISWCKEIKSLFPKIDIYILSTYFNSTSLSQALISGIKEFIYKPISHKRIDYIIEEYEPSYSNEIIDYNNIYIAMDNNDYVKSLNSAKELINIIFEIDDVNKRKIEMEHLIHNVFLIIPGFNKSQLLHYINKFNLTNRDYNIKEYALFWVESIICEVFRYKCSSKYSHTSYVFNYIENNIDGDLSVNNLAEHAKMSSSYLGRIFKKYYNISIVDYIHIRRIKQAKLYFINKSTSVTDIAVILGYKDVSYFTKIFKKYEGITPSEYCNLSQLENSKK